jgi:hypothetical protein
MYRIILLLLITNSYSQVLHHQVISSIGSSNQTPSGIYVSQTIGQFGAYKSYSNSNFFVQQGFQQSFKFIVSKILTDSKSSDGSITVMYPNPVERYLNFDFTKDFNEILTVEIFDFSGRIVYREEKNFVGKFKALDLSQILFSGNYIIKLSSPNYSYTNKFIKL